ncbi:putative histone-lysine n-methyltransferase [Diplodia seriata]|uniref:Histone-lysine N-methyltransferase, H3 lysine-4 specific n=1 Tax=Diplodia seriata TaxID=420778 RepID=A0A0G2H6G2_9PEZI|nr:putative histone-lysine n-methyltransferase [Diplodia seriata]
MSYPGPNTSIHALTPLTNTESSPPDKATSPRPSKSDHMSLTNTATYIAPPPGASQNVAPAEAITPATTPPQTRRQARPGTGEEKGFTVVYDPALDPKVPSNERHKRKATYRNIPRDDIAAPPDPRLAIAGYTTGAHNAARGVNKARLRPAPYTVKPYAPDKNTIGPQPATRILVTGLDPFTPEMQIKTFFSSFGSIAEFDNKIDPATGTRPIRPEHALVENEPIIEKIKRKPYIFIAHCYVPVLGTTIPHLKKRLKLYQWQEVRLDRTGYYIIFEDSKRGEDECERCFQECNMQALFTYVMNMECEKYGNPNYVRSPSPERVLAEKKKKEIEEEVQREEEQDLEEEKKERAENLDPVTAAKERLYTELLEQIMSDIKTRVAAPAIYDYLDPARHVARRKELGMQSFDDEDSDDEQSTLTRDTEEQESRSISRMSSAAPEEEDEVIQIRPSKRRKLDPLWGDADTQDAQARRLFPHLINKDPTDMADDLYKRAKSELKFRKIQRDAALVFGGEEEDEDSRAGSVQPPTEAATPIETVEEMQVETPEPEVPIKAEKKKPTKPKKKSKKQALLDEKLEPSPLKSEVEETPPIEPVPIEEVVPKVADILPENLITEDPIWGFSIDEPRSTIEEKLDYVMDIDGWQFTVKDAEDLRYLCAALENVRPTNLGDPNLFAYKEKHVKKLNTGLEGVAYKEVKIEDYYKPNPTGCARTEGVKKILEKEKSKYLPHRIRVQKAREEREALAKLNPNALAAQAAKPAVTAPKTSTTTSRSNRANNRRLVNEISTQKQALAADGSDNIAIRFNQLKKRKKLVKFDRSAIHNWGLYAQEDISANDMIIEYVGEKVRQKVADIREIKYDKQGVGSSYLFRIDEDSVVDATKKGGIARFINHSCTPNCTAKIIRVDGTKRIVIYALRDIKTNEELTYDYKFERELGSDDRIPCLCGSVNCKGFLN